MQKKTLSIIGIIALILVLIGAAYAITYEENEEVTLICVDQVTDCYVHGPVTVLSNNTTDNSTIIVLNQSNEKVVMEFTNVTDTSDEVETYNEFIYDELGRPCYFFEMDGCSYCVSIINSTNPELMTTDNLEFLLVISPFWETGEEDYGNLEINLGGLSLSLGLGLSIGDLNMGDLNIDEFNVYMNDSSNYTITGITIEGIDAENLTLSELIAKLLEDYTQEDLNYIIEQEVINQYDPFANLYGTIDSPDINDTGVKHKSVIVELTVINVTDSSIDLTYSLDKNVKGLLVIKIDDNEFTFNVVKQTDIIHIDCPITPNSKISAYFVPI